MHERNQRWLLGAQPSRLGDGDDIQDTGKYVWKEDYEFGFRCVEVENIQEEGSRSHQTVEERGGREVAGKATEGRKRKFQEVCVGVGREVGEEGVVKCVKYYKERTAGWLDKALENWP